MDMRLIDTSTPRFSHFAGMSEYQIKLAMWLADACIESAKLVISRRQIENNSKAINALCDEIEASHLSLAKWMEQERTGEQLNRGTIEQGNREVRSMGNKGTRKQLNN